MDRRKFLEGLSAAALMSVVAPAAAHVAIVPVVLRMHLAPDTREVVFSGRDPKQAGGLLQLVGKGNALWIHAVAWEDENGVSYSQVVRRNLPPGKAMALPPMLRVRKLVISVTCLPLANVMTLVELVSESNGFDPNTNKMLAGAF